MVGPDDYGLARSSVSQPYRLSARRFDAPVVIALVAATSLGWRLQPHDLSMQVLELRLVHPVFRERLCLQRVGWDLA
jgi:hypothetical protein